MSTQSSPKQVKVVVTDIAIKASKPCAKRAARSYSGYFPYKLGRPTQTPCGGIKFRRSARIAQNVGEAKDYQLYSIP